MPVLETQKAVDKAISSLKEYQAAVKAQARATQFTNDKLSALKTLTGVTGNDQKAIEEEVLRMLGQVTLNGFPERRGN